MRTLTGRLESGCRCASSISPAEWSCSSRNAANLATPADGQMLIGARMNSNSVRRKAVFGTIALGFCAFVCSAAESQEAKKGAAYPKKEACVALEKLPTSGGIWTLSFGSGSGNKQARRRC